MRSRAYSISSAPKAGDTAAGVVKFTRERSSNLLCAPVKDVFALFTHRRTGEVVIGGWGVPQGVVAEGRMFPTRPLYPEI
jgi:hypothetical protein